MNNYALLVDTTNAKFILLLILKNKVIASQVVDAMRKTGDLFKEKTELFLKQNKVALRDINDFYVITGPGSYTGCKIGVGFVKVLSVLHSNVNVYTMDSLLWQSMGEDAVSMLDARSNKHYFAVCHDGTEVVPAQIIDRQTCLDIAQQFAAYKIIEDYEGFDPQKAFSGLGGRFVKVEDVDKLEPLYIKPAV